MCIKPKGLHNRIDPCIRPLIKWLKGRGFETVASCCGHSVYPMTVVVRGIVSRNYYELFSGQNIPRTRKFYKKDEQGYYFIPEVLE